MHIQTADYQGGHILGKTLLADFALQSPTD